MKDQRTIVVQAADENDALRKAALKLDTSPSNIRIESKGKGKFEAQPINADADVRIKISDNKMIAEVDEVLQPLGEGGWPEPEALAAGIRAQGVAEPNQEAVEELASMLKRQQNSRGFIVARGKEPVEPADAKIEYEGDTDYPVLRGDNVGKKLSPRQGEDGVTVTGEIIPPQNQATPRDIELPDKFFAVEPETGEFSAKGYGLLRMLKEGALTIKPLMKITDNNLAIKGTVYHRGFSGEEMTFAKYRHMLAQMGIVVPADEAVISEAITQARKEDKPVADVILAQGEPPDEGQDGSFEMVLKSSKDQKPEDDENVDHRERSAFLSVKEGELIGRLHMPVRGASGRDVFGNEIKPPEVGLISVEPGEGVEVSANGLEFTATATGMVSWQGEVLRVVDALEVDGDVDYSTGNVRLEKGSVRIRGTVREGFVVDVPEDIVVEGSVEGAEIFSHKGDLSVSGGIVTGGKGRIMVAGDVKTSFAENAVIQAGGDIVVAQNMTNCRVEAEGKVICTSGKGLIQGGVIAAAKGVEANEIGSVYGVRTVFILGPPEEETSVEAETKEERKKLKDYVRKIDGALGGSDAKQILARTPAEKRPKIASIIKARMAAAKKLEDIEEQIKEENLLRLEACAAARLKFRIKAWPGTLVKVLGYKFLLRESTDASTISFNPRTMEFEVN